VLSAVGAVFVFAGFAAAADPNSPPPVSPLPLVGAPEGARAAWQRTYSIAPVETSLRYAVDRLASASGMTVVLDRRADPERKVRLEARDVPLGQIWIDLAASCGLSVSWVGPVVYLGPPEAAAALRTLAALRRSEAATMPADLRAKLGAKSAVGWSDLEEPRSLLASWAAEAGLRPAGEAVPHDLWFAARWPALSLVDRLTLLAIGFDRTFLVDPTSRTLTLVPIPAVVAIERSYPAPPNAAETVRRWQGLAPQAAVRLSAGGIVVVGSEEDFEAISSGRARPATSAVDPAAAVKPTPSGIAPSATTPPPPASPIPGGGKAKHPPGTRVFTMRADRQPLAAIVGALRNQGSDVRIDEQLLKQAGIDPAGRTSVDVRDATLVELLESAGKPLGLTARQVGTAVELVPRP